MTGSSIETKKLSEGEVTRIVDSGQALIGSQLNTSQTETSKSKKTKKKRKLVDSDSVKICKERKLVEEITTGISEPSLTNFSSPSFSESSESLVQSALKRLIMLGAGGVKGVKDEVVDDDDGEVSRDSSNSTNSLMMSVDHSSDPNGSVIDGGASNFETPTSLASSSTSNDQGGRKSCSSPDSKKKKARTTFTGRQIFELEKQFEIKKYLSSSERTTMAKLLNVTETQVSTNVPCFM